MHGIVMRTSPNTGLRRNEQTFFFIPTMSDFVDMTTDNCNCSEIILKNPLRESQALLCEAMPP